MTQTRYIPAAAVSLSLLLTGPALALSPFVAVPSPWPEAVVTETGDAAPTVSSKEVAKDIPTQENNSR